MKSKIFKIFIYLSITFFIYKKFENKIRILKYKFRIKKLLNKLDSVEDRLEKSGIQFMIAILTQKKIKDYNQAIIEYEKLIKEYPDSLLLDNVYYNKALCYEKLNNKRKAIESYKYILENFRNSYRLIDAKKRLDKLNEA